MELRQAAAREIRATIMPELRARGFSGRFPHFRRLHDGGRVDFLSFQFNRYGGGFLAEMAIAYPERGARGNFYFKGAVTAEVIGQADVGSTRNRLRIVPRGEDWFAYDAEHYRETVADAKRGILRRMDYFEKSAVVRWVYEKWL